MNITKIDWQKVNGLLPVIIQNISTREVLMLGYMNEEALTKTIKERKVTFFSRTKQRLWTKGEISGNFLNVEEMSLDCDNDTLLILVDPIGAWFIKLEQHLKEKKNADPSNSYTATLHAKGTKKIAQKVGEEGVETALAAVAQDKAEVISEATDLVYHLTVLLHNQDLQWYEIIAKLQERHQGIGLHPEGGNK